MIKIALKGLEFYAYHGFYEEERKMGNRFEVDMTVWAAVGDITVFEEDNHLDYTVNYEEIHRIISKVMSTPTMLLETLASRILKGVLHELPKIHKAEVTVKKMNPPLGGVTHHVEVTMGQSR
ncbi:dihydroneopterin aldolase [Rapidithrix thailandica]|uniref:7,8-dihydroneopterin aldolase n=1 Tax=Rapidithrix thailandica TaxID=413964 RepID=A0AAW9SEI3_9BACT